MGLLIIYQLWYGPVHTGCMEKSQLPGSSTPIYCEGRISVEEMGINRKEHLVVDTLMI